MFYHTTKVQYIWIVYYDSGYIRHYGPDSLLLQGDDIRNRSIVQLSLAFGTWVVSDDDEISFLDLFIYLLKQFVSCFFKIF